MTPEEILDQWRVGIRISQRAHLEASKYYQRLHLFLGVPNVVIATLLGTAVFINLLNSTTEWAKYVLAILSVIMIASSSLQAFLRYAERSERHRTTASQLGEVRRQLEEMLVFKSTNPIDKTMTEAVRRKWDSADLQAPTIPTAIYHSVENRVDAAEREMKAHTSNSTVPAVVKPNVKNPPFKFP
jgi:hypothetical protein